MSTAVNSAEMMKKNKNEGEIERKEPPPKRVATTTTTLLLAMAAVVLCVIARPPYPGDAASLSTNPSHWELTADDEKQDRPLIIVAGLSRTGTSSLQRALMELNMTVHHTHETMSQNLDFWYYYLNGRIARPNVHALLDGVEAMSDCWFAYLAPEIVKAFPRAKIILGTRESEAWLRSYNSYIENSDLYHWSRQVRRLALSRISRMLGLGSIFRTLRLIPNTSNGFDLEKLPLLMDVWRRIDTVVYGSSRPGPLWTLAFERHNAYTRSLVPPDRLLEFDIGKGHGWRELLNFLDIDDKPQLLDTPFPSLNCVPSKSCFSHLSTQATTTHERLTTALCLLFLLTCLRVIHHQFWKTDYAKIIP